MTSAAGNQLEFGLLAVFERLAVQYVNQLLFHGHGSPLQVVVDFKKVFRYKTLIEQKSMVPLLQSVTKGEYD
jgi:hypothetical protein